MQNGNKKGIRNGKSGNPHESSREWRQIDWLKDNIPFTPSVFQPLAHYSNVNYYTTQNIICSDAQLSKIIEKPPINIRNYQSKSVHKNQIQQQQMPKFSRFPTQHQDYRIKLSPRIVAHGNIRNVMPLNNLPPQTDLKQPQRPMTQSSRSVHMQNQKPVINSLNLESIRNPFLKNEKSLTERQEKNIYFDIHSSSDKKERVQELQTNNHNFIEIQKEDYVEISNKQQENQEQTNITVELDQSNMVFDQDEKGSTQEVDLEIEQDIIIEPQNQLTHELQFDDQNKINLDHNILSSNTTDILGLELRISKNIGLKKKIFNQFQSKKYNLCNGDRPQLKFLFEQVNVSLFRKTSQIIQNLSGQEIEEKDQNMSKDENVDEPQKIQKIFNVLINSEKGVQTKFNFKTLVNKQQVLQSVDKSIKSKFNMVSLRSSTIINSSIKKLDLMRIASINHNMKEKINSDYEPGKIKRYLRLYIQAKFIKIREESIKIDKFQLNPIQYIQVQLFQQNPLPKFYFSKLVSFNTQYSTFNCSQPKQVTRKTTFCDLFIQVAKDKTSEDLNFSRFRIRRGTREIQIKSSIFDKDQQTYAFHSLLHPHLKKGQLKPFEDAAQPFLEQDVIHRILLLIISTIDTESRNAMIIMENDRYFVFPPHQLEIGDKLRQYECGRDCKRITVDKLRILYPNILDGGFMNSFESSIFFDIQENLIVKKKNPQQYKVKINKLMLSKRDPDKKRKNAISEDHDLLKIIISENQADISPRQSQSRNQTKKYSNVSFNSRCKLVEESMEVKNQEVKKEPDFMNKDSRYQHGMNKSAMITRSFIIQHEKRQVLNNTDQIVDIIKSNKFEDLIDFLYQNPNLPINYQDLQGNSLLMIAVECDFKEAVQILIHQGANINIQNNAGDTALHKALTLNLFQIADLLINKGGLSNIQNNAGQSPWSSKGTAKE